MSWGDPCLIDHLHKPPPVHSFCLSFLKISKIYRVFLHLLSDRFPYQWAPIHWQIFWAFFYCSPSFDFDSFSSRHCSDFFCLVTATILTFKLRLFFLGFNKSHEAFAGHLIVSLKKRICLFRVAITRLILVRAPLLHLPLSMNDPAILHLLLWFSSILKGWVAVLLLLDGSKIQEFSSEGTILSKFCQFEDHLGP